MAVDVEFDGAGLITGLTAVNPHQLAREKLRVVGDTAQEHGKEAAEIARQGVGALASRMGKVALAATVLLWVAWFFMPSLSISMSVFGLGGSKSISLWNALAIDRNYNLTLFFNNADPGGSHGFLSLVVLAGIVAPFAASFIRGHRARYLYAAPLVCLLLAGLTIRYEFGQLLALVQEQSANMAALKISPDYGVFIIALASLVVAARSRRRPASESAAVIVANPRTGGVVSLGMGFCTNPDCQAPLSAGSQFCTKCGTQRASVA